MSDNPATPASKPTSERKAESNRRNAQKSTGPKTAQGKAWSRRNALKHGVLASQAVLTTVEGREARKAFEQLVDGLAHDFAPVGTFEQVLVQQIAACIWRQRRLLMFENRAAFRSRDDRTYREMNQPLRGMAPLYVIGRRNRWKPTKSSTRRDWASTCRASATRCGWFATRARSRAACATRWRN